VLRFRGSEVEPDLMVRQPPEDPESDWDSAPTPILVVEVQSPSTRRRDREQKKDFYLEAGVAAYWIVDPEQRTVAVIGRGDPERIERERVTWTPPGVASGLVVRVAEIVG
jgi:Uma2 family endonuclease